MKSVIGTLLFVISTSVAAATSVVVKPLSELLEISIRSAPAQVVNESHPVISSQLSARVEQVLVSVGDLVKKDQPLLQLECRDYELAQVQATNVLAALQAQLNLASQQLKRADKLLAQKSASQELRDQRRAERNALLAQKKGGQAQLDTTELAVGRCVPKAPFDGVISARSVSPGSLVAPGTPLVTLLGEGTQEVSAELDHNQIQRLKQGRDIRFESADKSYPVALRTVVPLIDQRARTQEVRLSFSGMLALSGSSGRILWQDERGRLPVKYIVSRQGLLGVMLYREGRAEYMTLPDAIEGQAAEIDLPSESLIIIEGQHAVVSGDDVTLAGQQ